MHRYHQGMYRCSFKGKTDRNTQIWVKTSWHNGCLMVAGDKQSVCHCLSLHHLQIYHAVSFPVSLPLFLRFSCQVCCCCHHSGIWGMPADVFSADVFSDSVVLEHTRQKQWQLQGIWTCLLCEWVEERLLVWMLISCQETKLASNQPFTSVLTLQSLHPEEINSTCFSLCSSAGLMFSGAVVSRPDGALDQYVHSYLNEHRVDHPAYLSSYIICKVCFQSTETFTLLLRMFYAVVRQCCKVGYVLLRWL